MGMSRGHSQGSGRVRAAHSRDYALRRRRPPADRLASYLHVVVLGPCRSSGAIHQGAVSVAMFPRHVMMKYGVLAGRAVHHCSAFPRLLGDGAPRRPAHCISSWRLALADFRD